MPHSAAFTDATTHACAWREWKLDFLAMSDKIAVASELIKPIKGAQTSYFRAIKRTAACPLLRLGPVSACIDSLAH